MVLASAEPVPPATFFFLPPNNLLSAPLSVDFFRWGTSLLLVLPVLFVDALTVEYRIAPGGFVRRWGDELTVVAKGPGVGLGPDPDPVPDLVRLCVELVALVFCATSERGPETL
jgi:hypothetical protein